MKASTKVKIAQGSGKATHIVKRLNLSLVESILKRTLQYVEYLDSLDFVPRNIFLNFNRIEIHWMWLW